jgi:hypothetical protein
MKQANGLESDQKLHCTLATFPLNVARLTSFVSLALFAAIDDAGCRDGLSMMVLSWMCRDHRCAPNFGYCRFGALKRTDSKFQFQWWPFTVAHGSVNGGQLSGQRHEVLNVGYGGYLRRSAQ